MTVVVARCQDVARSFGSGSASTVALHGTTCEVLEGQHIALTGPSGSGKSTLLHLLAGLDVPTTGTVAWPAIGSRRDLRPGPVAVVFQGPSLLPPLNVIENVALPLLLMGEDPDQAVVAAHAALERLGLDGLAQKLPEELSGGQAQRVAVARAMAGHPRLILADEPTGQLDHVAAAAVTETLIDGAAQAGAALVISTHDQFVAARLPIHWRIADGRLSVPIPASGAGRDGR
jgi:putative ABC transport system ATP-binding protein/lipoprotein-releasing system ATP-binding protein